MKKDQRYHLKSLLKEKQRRLRVLERQAATFGISTPPEIIIQIEDIKVDIVKINAQLRRRWWLTVDTRIITLFILGVLVVSLFFYFVSVIRPPTAEQTVRDYFNLLNQGYDDASRYEASWKMLSERFLIAQANRGGYTGYVGFWKDIGSPFQIESIDIEEQNATAKGFVNLIHLGYPINDQKHKYYVELVWNEQQARWLLDFSCEPPHEKIDGCPKQ